VHDWTGLDGTGVATVDGEVWGSTSSSPLCCHQTNSHLSLSLSLYLTSQAIPAGREATKEWSEEEDDEMMWRDLVQ
jgi:hypothetical protein